MMQEITLKLNIEETQLVLESLGNMPFTKVASLIGKVRQEAGLQLRARPGQGQAVEKSRRKRSAHRREVAAVNEI